MVNFGKLLNLSFCSGAFKQPLLKKISSGDVNILCVYITLFWNF
jgi:hypothetical protein